MDDRRQTWRITRAIVGLELRLVLRDRLALAFATLWPLVLFFALGFAAPERRLAAPIAVHVTQEVAMEAPWLGDAMLARGRITLVDEGSRTRETWTISLHSVAGDPTESAPSRRDRRVVTIEGEHGAPGTRSWLEDRVELALVADAPGRTEPRDAAPRLELRRSQPEATAFEEVVRRAWRHALASAIVWSVLVIAVNVAAGFGVERRNGTWTRLRVTALSTRALVAARILCVPLLAVPLAAPLLVLGAWVGVEWSTLATIFAALPLASIGLGALVICVVGWAPRSRAGQGLAWAVVLVLALLGGAMIPRPLMPEWIAAWSDASPLAWIAVTFGDLPPVGSLLTSAIAWVGVGAFGITMPILAVLTVGRDDV